MRCFVTVCGVRLHSLDLQIYPSSAGRFSGAAKFWRQVVSFSSIADPESAAAVSAESILPCEEDKSDWAEAARMSRLRSMIGSEEIVTVPQ